MLSKVVMLEFSLKIWQYSYHKYIYVEHIYQHLLISDSVQMDHIFPTSLWETACPLQIIIYVWLVFHNENLTWENLQKRNWSGLAICPLCRSNTENNLHIFLLCPQSQMIWQNLAAHFGFKRTSFPSIPEAFKGWSDMNIDWPPIPLLTIWAIWKWQNGSIFNSKKESHFSIFESILHLHNELGLSFHSRDRSWRRTLTSDPTCFF